MHISYRIVFLFFFPGAVPELLLTFKIPKFILSYLIGLEGKPIKRSRTSKVPKSFISEPNVFKLNAALCSWNDWMTEKAYIIKASAIEMCNSLHKDYCWLKNPSRCHLHTPKCCFFPIFDPSRSESWQSSNCQAGWTKMSSGMWRCSLVPKDLLGNNQRSNWELK